MGRAFKYVILGAYSTYFVVLFLVGSPIFEMLSFMVAVSCMTARNDALFHVERRGEGALSPCPLAGSHGGGVENEATVVRAILCSHKKNNVDAHLSGCCSVLLIQ